MARKVTADRRLVVVAVFLLSGLLIVSGKLVFLQIIQAGKFQKLADQQRDEVITVSPRRGTIFDREGEVLAISEDVTSVVATPYLVKNKDDAARKISQALGIDQGEVRKELGEKSGFVYIARKADTAKANKVKKLKIDGISFIDESKRFYPMGKLASQVLGIVDVDNKGQAGLELYYQKVLGGKPGKVMMEKDATGNPIPGTEKVEAIAADGSDVQVTLDKDIQSCVEASLQKAMDLYGPKAATAIVMDPNTGDILAMASNPTFDPNNRADVDPASMRNRAVTDQYEPGSAMKVVTASAALEEKVVEPQTVLTVPTSLKVADSTFKDAEPKPTRQLTFMQIIGESSNVGTIEVAKELGAERLDKYLSIFGMGHLTGIDFPGEVTGLVLPRAKWSGTSVATIAIGQGISVTPIQLACAVSAIANGGRKVCPHFLKSKVTDTGMKDLGLGGVGEQILSSQTCAEMAGILMQVVTPTGTAPKAAVRYYSVAGKTGTAEKAVNGGGYGGGYMATFVGFAPAERPRLLAMVVLDEPSPIWGGETAAPTFSDIMTFSLQHLKIPPSWSQQTAPDNSGGAESPSPHD
jgi:cell division protein FtsI/penicillin-binding protein 2